MDILDVKTRFLRGIGQQFDKNTPHHQKSGSSIVEALCLERASQWYPPSKTKTDNDTGRIGHAAKITMRRHGLIAPPLVPSGNGSPPHHVRPLSMAVGVDRRTAGGREMRRKGPHLDFRIFEVGQHHCQQQHNNQPRRPRRRARLGVP